MTGESGSGDRLSIKIYLSCYKRERPPPGTFALFIPGAGVSDKAMAFTMTAEYALRAIAELARNTEVLSSDEVSARTLVPRPYLVKILQQLQRDGLVESTRGKFGGWRLAPDRAKTMSLYDVVQSVDPICRIHSCPINLPEHKDQLCPLHAALDAAFAKLEETFRRSCVIDLVDTSVTVTGLVAGLEQMRRLQTARRGRRATNSATATSAGPGVKTTRPGVKPAGKNPAAKPAKKTAAAKR